MRSVLKLGDIVCGPVFSAEGGDISAPVLREPDGSFFRKRLGPHAPEPIALSFDLSLDSVVYEWIAQFWKGEVVARSGSVIFVDFENRARNELFFENARITATTLPAMDAASKTPCRLTIRLKAEKTNRVSGSGAVVAPVRPGKPWLPNFRLQVGRLETRRISMIEPLTAVADNGAIDFGDLRLLVSAQEAKDWSDWHHSFVVEGRNDEKSGTLTFLAPDLKNELGHVTLQGLGIHRLALEPVSERTEAIPRFAAELYCTRMELAVQGSREPSAAPLAETTVS